MKFSRMFIPTTKEVPKDATLPSHQYLVRGGFVNQIGSGIYNYLPLGKVECMVKNFDRWNSDEILINCIDRSKKKIGPDFELLKKMNFLFTNQRSN